MTSRPFWISRTRRDCRRQVIDWTHRYLNTVQTLTGRQPIIYTYPNFWRTQMANTTEFNHYPLWIADYNGQNAPGGPLPGGWSNWTFWQYTSTGRIPPGITGNTDINVYSGAQGDFDRYANSVGVRQQLGCGGGLWLRGARFGPFRPRCICLEVRGRALFGTLVTLGWLVRLLLVSYENSAGR